MEIASIAIAIVSALFSFVTYSTTVRYEKRKTTIEAVNLLQNEVLDKFVSISKGNARIIIENLDDEKCRKAYNDYRALVARLDHFAAGVNSRVYDFYTVDNILGRHFVYLYNKVVAIIEEANKNENGMPNYHDFVKLVKRLENSRKAKKREISVNVTI